ncbi:uracil phosphoribosyltransferase [Chondromyces apiculatus]|uniref:Uracil phosphoribosyltransferase n=1 Tax=Chondromyces apiculatus DSM 436 TaxID=1192034 RepID=A0A017T7L1_9BACT|nr:uracil phosphoribosyltransferase [Chondromyces apiculatus]EYF05229.1 Uracil phosphoribosyltransferase [Chondromyces apiculatus DSM 436]
MIDVAYAESRFRAPELAHGYGPGVHLLDDPLAWTLLARVCSPETAQPDVGRLVAMLYQVLARVVLAAEFPRARVDVPTRMIASHPEAIYRGTALSRSTKAVTVGIARAGTMPSQVVYDLMNEVLDPALVRQDHLFMSRQTNAEGTVTGATWHDAKIGRDVDERIVLFPDPMGATGSSMVSAVSYYKTALEGQPSKCIAMHLIVTPEYIRRVHESHPDLQIYALRLDRGLSPTRVLRTEPGTHVEEERGLNEHQYIVPGAGGVGEILNNAWL